LLYLSLLRQNQLVTDLDIFRGFVMYLDRFAVPGYCKRRQLLSCADIHCHQKRVVSLGTQSAGLSGGARSSVWRHCGGPSELGGDACGGQHHRSHSPCHSARAVPTVRSSLPSVLLCLHLTHRAENESTRNRMYSCTLSLASGSLPASTHCPYRKSAPLFQSCHKLPTHSCLLCTKHSAMPKLLNTSLELLYIKSSEQCKLKRRLLLALLAI
jgi:hypothetical protein